MRGASEKAHNSHYALNHDPKFRIIHDFQLCGGVLYKERHTNAISNEMSLESPLLMRVVYVNTSISQNIKSSAVIIIVPPYFMSP